jgi:hypothetical protein
MPTHRQQPSVNGYQAGESRHNRPGEGSYSVSERVEPVIHQGFSEFVQPFTKWSKKTQGEKHEGSNKARLVGHAGHKS